MTDQEKSLLNEFLARDVMQFPVVEINNGYVREVLITRHDGSRAIWEPTTDPAASFEVLRKLMKKGQIDCWEIDDEEVAVEAFVLSPEQSLNEAVTHRATAPTLELSICLLAKKLYAQRGEGEVFSIRKVLNTHD